MKSLCVYCGSKPSNNKGFLQVANDLGAYLGKNGIRLVYGGAKVGIMAEVANACLAHGGEVLGIMPKSLVPWEVSHQGLSELKIVTSMHERKALMETESDAFVALPGGLGTLDELFEILTWKQIKLHKKPVSIINVAGFFDHLLAHLKTCKDYDLVVNEDLLQLQTFNDLDQWQKQFNF